MTLLELHVLFWKGTSSQETAIVQGGDDEMVVHYHHAALHS
jgi:hypothetical protein